MNCLDYAYHYISRYPKTRKELIVQLLKKWYNSVEYSYAVWQLEKAWYIDDRQYTKLYINSELINKGKPLMAVRQKLYEKWVDKNLMNDCIAEMQDEIHEWISNKILKLIEEFKKKWVEWPFLISKCMARWYSLEQIKKVLNNRKEVE